MKHSPRLLLTLTLAILAAALVAPFAFAGPPLQANDPFIKIDNPPSNSIFNAGDLVSVTSTSGSSAGVAEVELFVDGIPSGKPDIPPGATPPIEYKTILRWTATAGTHVLMVQLTDSDKRSASDAIRIIVNGNTQTATPTAVSNLATPTPGAGACILSSKFIADVTIPDNTLVAPGGLFTKTWAIQNNGTCPWNTGYSVIFVGGEQMAGGSPAPISPAVPGEAIDISINFVAPLAPGYHKGTWQLQAPNGARFGTTFYVLIRVPGPPAQTGLPPPPTPVPPPPTPVPQGCRGAPIIQAFYVNPDSIQAGQNTTVRWKEVLNADYVSLVTPNGSGGVGTPGELPVQPHQTTTYTLNAYCKGFLVQAHTTVNVSHPLTPTPPPSPNQILSVQTQRKERDTKIEMRVEYYWNGEDAPAAMEGVGRREGKDHTNTATARIIAHAIRTVVLTVTGGLKITEVDACMVGRAGPLVCRRAPVR